MKAKIEMTEDEFENAQHTTHQSGKAAGLIEASGLLMSLAVDLFRTGNDEEAKAHRKVAKELKQRADAVHVRLTGDRSDGPGS